MLQFLFFISQVFAASQDECLLAVKRLHAAHPSVEIAFHDRGGGLYNPIVFTSGPLGREANTDTNTVLRACLTSGLDQAIFSASKGATHAKMVCYPMNLNTMSLHCVSDKRKLNVKRGN